MSGSSDSGGVRVVLIVAVVVLILSGAFIPFLGGVWDAFVAFLGGVRDAILGLPSG